MAEPGIYDLKKCTLKLIDGTTPTPLELVFRFDEGNLAYTQRKNIEYKLDRGKLDTASVREGDEEPLEVSIQGRFNKVTGSAGEIPSVAEFLDNIGLASSHVTTGDDCDTYCIDLVLEVDADCGTVLDEIITFDQFRYEEQNGDFGAGTLDISGKCKVVRPTSIRTDTVS